MYIDQLLPCNLQMQDDLENSVKEKNVIYECTAKEIVSDLNASGTNLDETNKTAGYTGGHLNVSMQNAETKVAIPLRRSSRTVKKTRIFDM